MTCPMTTKLPERSHAVLYIRDARTPKPGGNIDPNP
jgi:hypothetical protein